ncbi:MAG: DUF3631 domain-containing protein [Stellaceae bacterium]
MAPPDGDMPGAGPTDGVEIPAGAQAVEITADDAEIARLAKLKRLEYERERAAAAEKLGCRTAMLDKLVAAERDKATGRAAGKDAAGQGQPLKIADAEPWPEPVDGAALLDSLADTIRDHVVLDAAAADAVALWVVHTHAIAAASVAPRLAITSPEKRCGKTTLLTLLWALVARRLSAANMTAATMFRAIAAAHPTLLIDEADSFLGEAEEMRGVINAGHCRANAAVLRTVETREGFEVRAFDVFGPMAIAAIGKLPGTIEDRSIKIAMRRRRPDEAVERLRLDRLGDFVPLARRASRWVADHLAALKAADPVVPGELHDRAADNWRPLLAIADAAGGGWPERARRAAVALTLAGTDDAETTRTMLLRDLRELFEAEPSGVLFTSEILAALHKRDDRPWPEYRHGKQITARQLAALLAPLEIAAGTVRRATETAKGYRADAMADAFARYLTPSQSVTPSQVADSAVLSGISSVTPARNVTDRKRENPSVSAGCDGVTDKKPPAGPNGDARGADPPHPPPRARHTPFGTYICDPGREPVFVAQREPGEDEDDGAPARDEPPPDDGGAP